MTTIKVSTDASFYAGSGHAVAAIKDGRVIDAVYTDLPNELRVTDELQAKHPQAAVTAGMMSCYEFRPY